MLTTTPNPIYATTICDYTLCNLPQLDPPEHEKRAKSALFCCSAHSLLALSHPSHAGQNEDRMRAQFFSGHCHCCYAAPCPNPDYATTTIHDNMNHRDRKCTESEGGAGEPGNGALFPPPPFPLGLHSDSSGLRWTPVDSTGLTGPSHSDNLATQIS